MSETARGPVRTDSWKQDPITLGRFAAGLGVLLMISFPDVLLGWRSFFTRDFSNFGHPLAWYVQQSFRAGEIPLWNPYSFCGLPFLAQWNTLVLYPPSLIYVLLPLPWSLNLFNLLHLLLGGLGMFCLARRWYGDGTAASVAGVGYAFGGVMLSSLMWPNNVAALGWLPLVLLATARAAGEGGRWRCHAAVLVAVQFLAGAPELTVLTWAGVAVMTGCLSDEPQSRLWTRVRRLLPVLLVALCLTALQWLPFLELLAQSQRGVRYSSGDWTLTWGGLGNFFVPLFRTFPGRDGVFFQTSQQWVTTYYAGLTILLPAVAALAAPRRQRAVLLAAFGAGVILLAMGSQALLYDGLRKVLPGLGIMRYPIKFIVPIAVILPLMAAGGVRAVTQGHLSGRMLNRVAAGLAVISLGLVALSRFHPAQGEVFYATLRSGALAAVCLLVFWGLSRIARPHRSHWLIPVAMALTVFADLFLAGRGANPVVSAALLRGQAVELTPRPELGKARVMVHPLAHAKLDATEFPTPEAAVLIPRRALVLNNNLLERIPKLDGFFSLYLPGPATVIWRLGRESEVAAAGLRDFLGVTHVSDPANPERWTERPNALPWMTLVPRAEVRVATNILDEVLSNGFDPREVAYLPPDPAPVRLSGRGRGSIRSAKVGHHSLEAMVETDGAMLLVIAQAAYPGWRAFVDGQPAPLHTANHAYQAVEIPAGRHEVKVHFRSTTFELGAALSVLSLCFLAMSGFRQRN